ncbi:hypothetical protein CK203_054413 [Vitis vinifera]|uniref:Uncharacterized protein n=1 Tax=Vitis vinifera TaxID=29760 RepID=A0A438GG63_VITVI|nr:hypothetical protein CK203_054413 [Vitis vinifera]
MATPSQSRSSGREEEDNHEWRQAIEKRQLASEKQLKALLQEHGEVKGRKRCVTHSSLNIRTSSSSALKRPGGKLKTRARIIYLGQQELSQERTTQGPIEPRTPMPRAPREESSDSTHFSAKRQRDRKSQLSSSMRARLGPQEPGRSRPPAATTRAPRPDPMIAPMVQERTSAS